MDHLTKIYNRRGLMYFGSIAAEKANKQHKAYFVVFVDFDDFKRINDEYGHVAGDELLYLFAQRLKHRLRKGTILSRIGGDEFAIVLTGDVEQAMTVKNRIVEILHRPFNLGQAQVEICASIGLASYPEDGQTLEELIRHADLQMYKDKKQHQN